MDKKYIIIWQKWVDPFGQDEEPAEEFDPYVGEYDSYIENEENKVTETAAQNISKPVRVIATPMGIIPMNDNTASGKLFNFWMGHTNFDISKRIASIIEKINGVETLDIFTRYRFRISIGKAFNDSQTMRDINTTVYNELNNV